MRRSTGSLTFLLLHSISCFSPSVPQVPLDQSPEITEAKYGYVGPGVYRIISYSSNYTMSLNTSESTTGVVSMPPDPDDAAQKWLIEDVSETEKILISDDTKAILTALKGNRSTLATPNPPYELFDHWVLDFERYSDYTNSPVMITNVGKKNTALDLTNSQKQAGTPVLSYPINEPKTKNQAWLLEHLPERSCEFPEADQKALRGDVVPECDTFRTQHLHAPDAKECYDRMNLFKFFGIESYVFTSHSEPGSPSGNGEWGYCAGYSVRSYKFFVGSSTGSGFGGDLDLPFS